jgi:oligosaccharide repeat unit polymerase
LLSSNIDATRIAGGSGLLGRVWTWIIGGLEWIIVIGSVRCFALGRRSPRALAAVGASGGILVLLAGRSFLVVAGLAAVVALGVLRRVSLKRLVAICLVAVIVLGIAGKYRLTHSGEAGQGDERNTFYGLVSQSAGTGPSVFATALKEIPQVVPFQDGTFILRDLRATMPFHIFGASESADFWVTRQLRARDTAVVGGSPPTLPGGLYIDFGITGIVVGSALLGLLLALMYRWTLRAQTVGAVAAYSYSSAYVALSAYSYVSIKPTVIAAMMLSVTLHFVEKPRRRSQRLGSLARREEVAAG